MTQTAFVALWRLCLAFFFNCALAHSILGWMQSLAFPASSLCPSLLCSHVFFGFSASELAVFPRVFVYLLNLARYFLWRARNDYCFCDVQPGALPLIEVIKAHAKCHLCIFFKRFRSARCQCYFHRQWGGKWCCWESVGGVHFTFVSSLSECLTWFPWSLLLAVLGCLFALSECVCGLLVAFLSCTGCPSCLSECLWSVRVRC